MILIVFLFLGLLINKIGFAVINISHLSQIVDESTGKYTSRILEPNFEIEH